MERNNKENKVPRSECITSVFKVKKCLFGSVKKEFVSPKSVCSSSLGSPIDLYASGDDSPYSLFKVRRKRTQTFSENVSSTKNVPEGSCTTPTHKRCNREETKENEGRMSWVDSSSSESWNTVEMAVEKAILNPNLTGDFSKQCLLPTVQGRHADLQSITPETVADLLKGRETFSYSIIDCRYPYEFEGGHIQSARNIYTKEDADKEFLSRSVVAKLKEKRNIVIFYCEFSSERGPSMLRFLRSKDRDLNKDCYPYLHYPELYIMEGGYKAFYSHFKELCEPQEYKTMLDKDCSEDLSFYRAKCKSWSRRSKRGRRARSSLVF